jgi:hypothetical protein
MEHRCVEHRLSHERRFDCGTAGVELRLIELRLIELRLIELRLIELRLIELRLIELRLEQQDR